MSISSSLVNHLLIKGARVGRDVTADGAKRGWLTVLVGMLLISLISLFAADLLFHPQKFRIDEIVVHGLFENVDGEQIKNAVQTGLDGNYFTASLAKLENEIERLPWVFSVSLRRKWPSAIIADVVEVQPVARWGNEKWLNFTGDLVSKQDGVMDDYQQMPLLHGPENEVKEIWKAFQKWSDKFASSGLTLIELTLDPGGLYHFQLSLGALASSSEHDSQNHKRNEKNRAQVTMIVEKKNSEAGIQRFIDVLNGQLIQFPLIRTVDLRYPNGFAVSWRDSAPATGILAESDAAVEPNLQTEPE